MASMPVIADYEIDDPNPSDDEHEGIALSDHELAVDMSNPLGAVSNIDAPLDEDDAQSVTVGEILVRMYDWMSKNKSTDSSGIIQISSTIDKCLLR